MVTYGQSDVPNWEIQEVMEDVKIIEKRRHTDKRETLSNPSLRKNPMVPDGSEAPVIYRSLGTYRSYRKVSEKTGDVAWI